jgi:hypothetical protein
MTASRHPLRMSVVVHIVIRASIDLKRASKDVLHMSVVVYTHPLERGPIDQCYQSINSHYTLNIASRDSTNMLVNALKTRQEIYHVGCSFLVLVLLILLFNVITVPV